MSEDQIDSRTSKLAILTPSRIRRVRMCIEILEGYPVFRKGQDGYQALVELRQFVDELAGKEAPYGYCPHCQKPGISRERRLNGNDTCESGHVYPSSASKTSVAMQHRRGMINDDSH